MIYLGISQLKKVLNYLRNIENKEVSSSVTLPKCLQQPRFGQAEAGSQECNPAFSREWTQVLEATSAVSHQQQEPEIQTCIWYSNPSTLIWDVDDPTGILTIRPNACPSTQNYKILLTNYVLKIYSYILMELTLVMS